VWIARVPAIPIRNAVYPSIRTANSRETAGIFRMVPIGSRLGYSSGMSDVVVIVGSLLAGTLAALWGARWAAAMMGTAGALLTLTIAIAVPYARHIR